jgi:hypothetical protein
MELSGRPLFDNPLDARRFVPREEGRRLERNCIDGINTLVLGEPGSGKTSLLRNVLLHLREDQVDAVLVDAGPAQTILDLLALIEDSLRGAGRPDTVPTQRESTESGAALATIRRLGSYANSEQRVAILVDLAPGSLDVHALFGRFRDELWQLPFTWVVGAPTTMRNALLTPPADAFFDEVIELGAFSRPQQEELIHLRLDEGEKSPWRLPQGGEGNPRRLLQLARESMRSGEPIEVHFDARSLRHQEVAAIGHSAAVVYADLEANGPASASDEEFLARLGWSRQRAAQVLADLERADLVRPESRPGPSGRPRKVFAIVPPTP